MKERGTRKPNPKRSMHPQELSFEFPEPTQSSMPSMDPYRIESGAGSATTDYPSLRRWLHERGIQFKPVFAQGDVAGIIGKTSRTVREWTRKSLMPCHYWPSGEVYYTAEDLENLLADCGRRPTRRE